MTIYISVDCTVEIWFNERKKSSFPFTIVHIVHQLGQSLICFTFLIRGQRQRVRLVYVYAILISDSMHVEHTKLPSNMFIGGICADGIRISYVKQHFFRNPFILAHEKSLMRLLFNNKSVARKKTISIASIRNYKLHGMATKLIVFEVLWIQNHQETLIDSKKEMLEAAKSKTKTWVGRILIEERCEGFCWAYTRDAFSFDSSLFTVLININGLPLIFSHFSLINNYNIHIYCLIEANTTSKLVFGV